MKFIQRMIKNPKTTIGGLINGTVFATVGGALLAQAGCDFGSVDWMVIVGLLFGGPAAQGAAGTDNGERV